MNRQNTLASFSVWQSNIHLTIKTTGAKQGRIEHIWAVGSCQDDHLMGYVEAIHLNQELIKRLLTLVVDVADACTTSAANGIQLVNENNGWGSGFRLFEQGAYTAGTYTNEHLNKF